MNNQEAKFILSAYRSNGVDAKDELFAEALRQAEQDPGLKAWLTKEQALDSILVAKLKEITPPATLREAILAGAKVSRTHRTFWNRPQWISISAAAALLVVSAVTFWPKDAVGDDSQLASFALADIASANHGGHDGDVQAIQAVLGDPQLRLSSSRAVNFEMMRRGCRSVRVDGREVFEICFNRTGTWFHLYAVRDRDGDKPVDNQDIAFQQSASFACATWSDPVARVRYALVGSSGVEELKRLL
jgi:hypothetical protein